MGSPLLLVDNFANTRLYTGHVLVGDEEASGFEAFRVADGRRSQSDCWQPTTPNVQHYLHIDCAVARTPNVVALDRNHNLAGIANVKLQHSDNDSTWTDDKSVTIPAVGSGGADITAANGVTTEEGAWLATFSGSSHRYWRLLIPAMGTGLVPSVIGWWLGAAWTPSFLDMPWSEDQDDVIVQETVSDRGWVGRGPVTPRRSGTATIHFDTLADYDTTARPHLRKFRRGRPLWICYDQQQADRAFLALSPGAHIAPGFNTQRFPRELQLPYEEHEAVNVP